jgi:serine/threonine protein kinase
LGERTGADDLGSRTEPPTAAPSLEPAPERIEHAGHERADARAEHPGAALGMPERVGPYEILGRLGAGGMGTVFLGRRGGEARVAVKVVRPELARDPAFLRMFRHEVAAARRVVGFCTARVLDADVDGPVPYLVTEYVDGVRLDRAVAGSGGLSATDLEGLAVGMAAALTAIHGAGVVHRDLKPSNVLLSYFGPKVIDFGIARALDGTTAATGRLMGTPAWMAPEQFSDGPATAAVDVFMWGSLVAYAGTGRQPFGRGTVVELAYRITHEPPDLEGLDGRLRELVEACMDKLPDRRPTARTVLLGLLGDQAATDPQAEASRLLERRWSPQAAGVQTPPPTAGVQTPPTLAGVEPRPAPAGAQPTPTQPAHDSPVHGGAGRRRRKRRGRAVVALSTVAVVAVALVVRVNGLPDLTRHKEPGSTVTTASAPAPAALPPKKLPLCGLLGDLGAGATLRSKRADQEVATAAAAAGQWLPDPAALPQALDDHHFQGGCTRTWPEPAGEVVAALFQFPSRTDAIAMRGQLRDQLRARGVDPVRVPRVTGGELYLLDAGGGSGQLVMFPCNDRVLQIHAVASGGAPSPLLVRLAQGANQRLHERTGCPL